MPIKAVTVDFWNTLFDSSGGLDRNNARLTTLLKVCDEMGYFVKTKEIERALEASWKYFNDVWTKEAKTPLPLELVEYLWNELKLPDVKEAKLKIVEAFSTSILSNPPKLMSGAKTVLDKLSSQYKLAIISDTGFSPGSVLRELLRKEDLEGYFSAFSFSDETGAAKPSPEAFFAALNRLGVEPEEAVHIGDIEQTDILGAKKIGMRAIRFSGDEYPFLPKNNPKTTRADFEVKTWFEIIDAVENLDGKR